MPPRTTPTERQKRLGSELRKMRTAAGMTADQAAGLLGLDRAKISNIETGIRTISPERLRTLACNCACSDQEYVEALVAMARPRGRGWWERYRGALSPRLLDIAELESYAVRMRTAHTAHIPGLFQTSDHSLELFRAVLPPLPEHEVALRLAFRAERQKVLEGENPPEYVGVVHEAALRMQFGGRKTARAQLEHLLAVSERPAVRLLVIPFSAGTFPGAGATVNYLEGSVPQLDTAQVDSSHGPEFLSDDAQLAKYRAHLDWMERIALSPEASRDFIRVIANDL
ncbi:helix-turn-helix domain-containing protein [Streptomyces ipomoeae]|uniref:Toxin-antitoxin system, antitoxin component, Xre family n=1 Tax=Streptomyces ipomoeae 91-03 TaxID=698759 RepID=L1KQL3_9ACTN|nr:helix-turn-helix transcriptional regulator [Streptomyces ipomoeae]EKX62897.1 toxin-antitoxin system, antitoxin component, Xre family [Streptomyces ipomoeae 91-03]MDX2698325.1 helix-turn-helix transcriptional regulator [Streptomyces ipomoeae]MDX2843962.1 helix-turn-helix transcriptional regulator [Streptomyces ipomoeae]